MPKGKSSKHSIVVVVGKGNVNSSLTNASAAGGFVVTRFEIDTPLCLSWDQLGKTFSMWRLKSLKIHFTPIVGTTTVGLVGMAIITDPNGTTPGTTAQALSLETSSINTIYRDQAIKYKPVDGLKWKYTRDAVASTEDRLEMYGDFIIWSDNTAVAQIPGVVWLEYSVEFLHVGNSTVLPSPVVQPSLKGVGPDHIDNDKGEDQDLQNRINSLKMELSALSKRL